MAELSLLPAFRPADILLNWDVPETCFDAAVVSPIKKNMPVNFEPGAAASAKEDEKYCMHEDACAAAGYGFRAFVVDAFGVLAPDAKSILKRLASLLEVTKNYPEYLARQLVHRRISFAVHVGVARQLVARREWDFFF